MADPRCGAFEFAGGAGQTFLSGDWTQGSPAVTVGVDTNGTLVATAPLNSSFTFNSTETATTNPQFLWVPALSAFRVGKFTSAPSTTTMGQYSVAFGNNNTASGLCSAAFGASNTASGYYATAFGSDNTASYYSATVFGSFNYASGSCSIAAGQFTIASGSYSVAFGDDTQATGGDAVTFGFGATASGWNSTAMGQSTSATSENSLAVGAYNTGLAEPGGPTPSATNWVLTDPLFEIGNGTPSTHSDAFVVYKDGNAKLAGSLTVPQSGDIPMYTGN